MDRDKALALLPAKIKVRVNEDRMGNVILSPVSARVAELVGISNAYNGSNDAYIQNSQDIQWLMETWPKVRYYRRDGDYIIPDRAGRKRRYSINDNAVFIMDSYDFRHLVGGQSD